MARPSSANKLSLPAAWSSSITGCNIKGGACYGKTDANGNKVTEGEMDAGPLFATIYRALGINPHKNYYVGSRPVPLVNPGVEERKELIG